MNPENSREELEIRITALLLGELPDDEASALRQAIAQNAELTRLHDRLKFAIELARETSSSPAEEEVAKPEELKLAPERRARLLATVAAPKILKLAQQRRTRRRELLALAAMIVVLATVAGMLMPLLDRPRTWAKRVKGHSDFVLVGNYGSERAAATIDDELIRYAARDQAQAKEAPDGRIQISGQVELPRANQPAVPARSAPVPSRSIRGDSVTDRSAFSLMPPPENKEGKDPKSGNIVVSAGRIALPEPEAAPREGGQISRESAATDLFADSNLHSVNDLVWSAPVPGTGGGGGVGGGMVRTPVSGGPQTGQTSGGFDQNNRSIQLFSANAIAQNPLAGVGDLGGPIKVLEEQPRRPIDPATGLPVEVGMVGYVNEAAGDGANGTPVTGPWANNTFGGANFFTLTTNFMPAIDGLAANLPPKSDYDGDGTARTFRFKGRALHLEKAGSNAVSGGEFVGTPQQPAPTSLAVQEARRAEIVLPSQPRGDGEKQVTAGSSIVVNETMANPVPKSVERLADVQDRPTSEDA